MRIAVLVIGLVLTVGLFIQAIVIFGLSDAVNQENTEQAGAVGVLMALMWLVGCGLVIPVPRVSMVVFAVAGLLGFAASGDYPDLAVWGGISIVLAVFCYFGYRGKRKDDRRADSQAALIQQAHSIIAASQPAPSAPVLPAQTVQCPQCHAEVAATARFCPECGFARS